MLPAKNRLNLKKTSGLRQAGKRIPTAEFTLVGKPKAKIFKLATIVSKKVAARAVDRNRIKRIVAESLREQKIFEGELVVISKKNLAHLRMKEVKEKLTKLLRKL